MVFIFFFFYVAFNGNDDLIKTQKTQRKKLNFNNIHKNCIIDAFITLINFLNFIGGNMLKTPLRFFLIAVMLCLQVSISSSQTSCPDDYNPDLWDQAMCVF